MRHLRSLALPASILASTVVLAVGQASALAYKDPTGDDVGGGARPAPYSAVTSHPSRPPLALKAPPTT